MFCQFDMDPYTRRSMNFVKLKLLRQEHIYLDRFKKWRKNELHRAFQTDTVAFVRRATQWSL
jgi:hypothetical protein